MFLLYFFIAVTEHYIYCRTSSFRDPLAYRFTLGVHEMSVAIVYFVNIFRVPYNYSNMIRGVSISFCDRK